MNSVFGIDKLLASAFINALGKVENISSEILYNRLSRVTFSNFDFRIDLTQEDSRIQRYPFWFHFPLRLPQQHFNTGNNKVEYISSTEKKESSVHEESRTSLSIYCRRITVVFSQKWEHEPEISSLLDRLKIYLPHPLAETPKNDCYFKDSNNIKVGYFGKLKFLDNQAAFTEVFGDKPTIIAPNTITSQDTK